MAFTFDPTRLQILDKDGKLPIEKVVLRDGVKGEACWNPMWPNKNGVSTILLRYDGGGIGIRYEDGRAFFNQEDPQDIVAYDDSPTKGWAVVRDNGGEYLHVRFTKSAAEEVLREFCAPTGFSVVPVFIERDWKKEA